MCAVDCVLDTARVIIRNMFSFGARGLLTTGFPFRAAARCAKQPRLARLARSKRDRLRVASVLHLYDPSFPVIQHACAILFASAFGLLLK